MPSADVLRSVTAVAPVRIADVGGWTDTWFGAPGRVCHVAVAPGVTAQARLVPAAEGNGPVRLLAPDVGANYLVGPDELEGWSAPAPGRDPLLEHAIAASVDGRFDSAEHAVQVRVGAAVPAGASLGTSASAVVAVLAALDLLLGDGNLSGPALAQRAHEIETIRAGREAGVQDQWAAAMGGCGLLEIGGYQRGSSPQVRHQALAPSDALLTALAERVVTVVFAPHDSSAVHRQVINTLLHSGGAANEQVSSAMRTLIQCAQETADALQANDFDAWAHSLQAATDAAEQMHPALVGAAHRAAIEVARSVGSPGWKVNGAGGAGGSLTIALPEDADRAEVRRRLLAVDGSWTVLDLRPCGGVRASVDEL